ncbi:hypothetical protein [Arthrobacter ramosus]|uniref:hypothetical protein n=1 Tax=Arthrobacter ramosus TaxID=1672 RepID=UPI001F469D92|nr:hypothetical protein [Arthrobacter ramosus]
MRDIDAFCTDITSTPVNAAAALVESFLLAARDVPPPLLLGFECRLVTFRALSFCFDLLSGSAGRFFSGMTEVHFGVRFHIR